MREIRKKSPIPIYGMAAVCVLYCLIFPLYAFVHFIILAAACALSYFVLSKVFPGKIEYVEIPEVTGNEELDALLRERDRAISELKRLRASINKPGISPKIDELISLINKIFNNAKEDPDDIGDIKRFASYFLPTTLKLLNAYDRMGAQGIQGQHISETMTKIEDILDTTILAYRKQLDRLFANQAFDIDTDITVLEAMLKREGLSGKDF